MGEANCEIQTHKYLAQLAFRAFNVLWLTCNTKILHTKEFNTKISQITSMCTNVCYAHTQHHSDKCLGTVYVAAYEYGYIVWFIARVVSHIVTFFSLYRVII